MVDGVGLQPFTGSVYERIANLAATVASLDRRNAKLAAEVSELRQKLTIAELQLEALLRKDRIC